MSGSAWRLFFLLALYCPLLQSSRGDDDPVYQGCVANCIKTRLCSANPHSSAGLPFHLRLMGWNCTSNCKYDCMWHIVDEKRRTGGKVYQYHGKWPFIRLFGFQEFASVVFSAGNAVAHYIGYRNFKRALGQTGFEHFFLSSHYTIYFLASVIAWISAMLFHTRDVPWTEHADYLTAITSIFVALYNTVLRHLYLTRPTHQALVGVPFAILLMYHLHYMLFVSFDYGWNMKLLACMFGAFAVIWLSWGLRNFTRSLQAKLAILWVVGAAMCGALEIFDIEPIADLVDAHALWHLGTIPLVLLIWKIYSLDAEDLLDNPDKLKASHSLL